MFIPFCSQGIANGAISPPRQQLPVVAPPDQQHRTGPDGGTTAIVADRNVHGGGLLSRDEWSALRASMIDQHWAAQNLETDFAFTYAGMTWRDGRQISPRLHPYVFRQLNAMPFEPDGDPPRIIWGPPPSPRPRAAVPATPRRHVPELGEDPFLDSPTPLRRVAIPVPPRRRDAPPATGRAAPRSTTGPAMQMLPPSTPRTRGAERPLNTPPSTRSLAMPADRIPAPGRTATPGRALTPVRAATSGRIAPGSQLRSPPR